eukprot:219002_1
MHSQSPDSAVFSNSIIPIPIYQHNYKNPPRPTLPKPDYSFSDRYCSPFLHNDYQHTTPRRHHDTNIIKNAWPHSINRTKQRRNRDGDWDCGECGYHNFATRAKCNMCTIPKTINKHCSIIFRNDKKQRRRKYKKKNRNYNRWKVNTHDYNQWYKQTNPIDPSKYYPTRYGKFNTNKNDENEPSHINYDTFKSRIKTHNYYENNDRYNRSYNTFAHPPPPSHSPPPPPLSPPSRYTPMNNNNNCIQGRCTSNIPNISPQITSPQPQHNIYQNINHANTPQMPDPSYSDSRFQPTKNINTNVNAVNSTIDIDVIFKKYCGKYAEELSDFTEIIHESYEHEFVGTKDAIEAQSDDFTQNILGGINSEKHMSADAYNKISDILTRRLMVGFDSLHLPQRLEFFPRPDKFKRSDIENKFVLVAVFKSKYKVSDQNGLTIDEYIQLELVNDVIYSHELEYAIAVFSKKIENKIRNPMEEGSVYPGSVDGNSDGDSDGNSDGNSDGDDSDGSDMNYNRYTLRVGEVPKSDEINEKNKDDSKEKEHDNDELYESDQSYEQKDKQIEDVNDSVVELNDCARHSKPFVICAKCYRKLFCGDAVCYDGICEECVYDEVLMDSD